MSMLSGTSCLKNLHDCVRLHAPVLDQGVRAQCLPGLKARIRQYGAHQITVRLPSRNLRRRGFNSVATWTPMTRSKIIRSVWPSDIPGHLEASIETQLRRPDDANRDGFSWHTITRAVRTVLGQKPSVIVSLDADRKVNTVTLHDNPDPPAIAGNWLG